MLVLLVFPSVAQACQGPGNWGFRIWNPRTWFLCEGINWYEPFPETEAVFGIGRMALFKRAGLWHQIAYLNRVVAMHEGKSPRTTVEALKSTVDQTLVSVMVAELAGTFMETGFFNTLREWMLDQTGSFRVPSWKSATSRELRKLAENAGLVVRVGAEHLKVYDRAGRFITSIPHTVKSPYTAKGIVDAILTAAGRKP